MVSDHIKTHVTTKLGPPMIRSVEYLLSITCILPKDRLGAVFIKWCFPDRNGYYFFMRNGFNGL